MKLAETNLQVLEAKLWVLEITKSIQPRTKIYENQKTTFQILQNTLFQDNSSPQKYLIIFGR